MGYLGSRRKDPRSSFMIGPMGDDPAIDPYQSPPIIAVPGGGPIRPIYQLPPIQSPPIYQGQPPQAPPPPGSVPLRVTVGDRVYAPPPVVGYAIMGFAGYCVYAGTRDLLRMFMGKKES